MILSDMIYFSRNLFSGYRLPQRFSGKMGLLLVEVLEDDHILGKKERTDQ